MPDTSFMDDVIFPVHVSRGTAGGPDWPAEIRTLGDGSEERNSPWSAPLRTYDARYGVRTPDELYDVLKVYHVALGRLRGFRMLDWTDYRSGSPAIAPAPTDQLLGAGTGALATFQCQKTYAVGSNSFARTIKKLIANSTKVAVAGAEKTAGTHFNVNVNTGVITFTGGNIPTMGQAVTAGFEFHVPVRFDCKLDQISMQGPYGDIPSIYLKELRSP